MTEKTPQNDKPSERPDDQKRSPDPGNNDESGEESPKEDTPADKGPPPDTEKPGKSRNGETRDPAEEQKPGSLEDLKFDAKALTADEILLINDSESRLTKECSPLLEQWGLKPLKRTKSHEGIISVEQILQDHPGVRFAIVYLSGTEFVYPKEGRAPDAKLRERQQTVFDLGFLVGQLGRRQVFVLYHEQKSFLLPSEYTHAVYTPFDRAGHWRKELRRRLKACGYSLG